MVHFQDEEREIQFRLITINVDYIKAYVVTSNSPVGPRCRSETVFDRR